MSRLEFDRRLSARGSVTVWLVRAAVAALLCLAWAAAGCEDRAPGVVSAESEITGRQLAFIALALGLLVIFRLLTDRGGRR